MIVTQNLITNNNSIIIQISTGGSRTVAEPLTLHAWRPQVADMRTEIKAHLIWFDLLTKLVACTATSSISHNMTSRGIVRHNKCNWLAFWTHEGISIDCNHLSDLLIILYNYVNTYTYTWLVYLYTYYMRTRDWLIYMRSCDHVTCVFLAVAEFDTTFNGCIRCMMIGLYSSSSRADPEQMLSRSWADPEQIASRSWWHDQILNRSWADPEQILSRSWADPEQILSRSWADPEQISRRSLTDPKQIPSRADREQIASDKRITFDIDSTIDHYVSFVRISKRCLVRQKDAPTLLTSHSSFV